VSTRPPHEEEDPEFWQWVTAYHEAAHAVAYWEQDLTFRYVTIRPRRNGITGQVALWGARRCRSSALSFVAAAGPIAEAKVTFAAWTDDRLMEVLGGITADDESDVQGDLDTFVRVVPWPSLWLATWRAHEQFIGSLWPAVEAVASTLLGSPRALTYREVDRICSPLVYPEDGSR
jgi:hypothetical protein